MVNKNRPSALYLNEPLANMLRKEGLLKTQNKGSVIIDGISTTELCLIETGSVCITRKSDHLLLGAVEAPVLLGLTTLFHTFDYIMKAETKVTYYSLPREKALEMIKTYDLWEDVARLQSYHLSRFVNRDNRLTGKSAYEIIKAQLEELGALPLDERVMISTYKYIVDRSGISRSRVYHILQQLTKGGYIKINNGILVAINPLPSKF